MTSNEIWTVLCGINVLRCHHSDVRKAAESDPNAIQDCLLSEFREWNSEYCQVAAQALQRYQDEGQGIGLETEMNEFRKFLNRRTMV